MKSVTIASSLLQADVLRQPNLKGFNFIDGTDGIVHDLAPGLVPRRLAPWRCPEPI